MNPIQPDISTYRNTSDAIQFVAARRDAALGEITFFVLSDVETRLVKSAIWMLSECVKCLSHGEETSKLFSEEMLYALKIGVLCDLMRIGPSSEINLDL